MSATSFDFATLLQPLEAATFFETSWEEQPLIVARQTPQYYRQLLTMDDVDTVLHFNRPHPPDVRVIQNQQELLPATYVTPAGGLNLNQLYKAYEEGYTIIINEIHRFWPPIARFCQRVRKELNHDVVANMYLSPAHSKGLLPHFDTHDVFVLQVAGAKQWRVYEAPEPSPLLGSFQPVISQERLPKLLHDVHLQDGDLLYLPRGVVHEADAKETSSLHLTLGIYPTQWHDLLSHALTALSLREPSLRKALPVGFLERPEITASLKEQFQAFAALFADAARIEEALALLADGFVRHHPPLPDGHFRQVDAISTVTVETTVTRRPGLHCRVLVQGDAASIQFPGNTITGHKHLIPMLSFIARTDTPFVVCALPGHFSDEGKVTLVQRLIRGGLLRIVQDV